MLHHLFFDDVGTGGQVSARGLRHGLRQLSDAERLQHDGAQAEHVALLAVLAAQQHLGGQPRQGTITVRTRVLMAIMMIMTMVTTSMMMLKTLVLTNSEDDENDDEEEEDNDADDDDDISRFYK